MKNSNSKIDRYFKKLFPIIWTICLVSIPLFNTNWLQSIFNDNISYFQGFWIWFLILGISFIISGIKIASMAMKLYKVKVNDIKEKKLIKRGIYSIIRHPVHLCSILLFMGFSFVFDSFLAILFIPFFILFLEVHCILEEKYILIPNFGEEYLKYKEQVPFRLFSRPYNYLLIIIAFIVIYIGILNFFLGI